MPFDELITFYHTNRAWLAGLGVLAGVALLLAVAVRVRAMNEHRATLLVANVLTIVAAALATMVSASGMWKFFTDILGPSPLRYAFFGFIETALFASALLARSRLLREPEKGSTGVDGVAVWVLAGLTATLSALDSDSFYEGCLRLVAPLVAAWMWERALAAERQVRLGANHTRINWTLTPQRIFVWLRLADTTDRDVSTIDHTRRRTALGRARLRLHLLQHRKASGWRVRRAHRNVIKQAMRAAEHIGLADIPNAGTERDALQMYMATIYGLVDATTPQAVAHLNAWRTINHSARSGRRDTAAMRDDLSTPPPQTARTVDDGQSVQVGWTVRRPNLGEGRLNQVHRPDRKAPRLQADASADQTVEDERAEDTRTSAVNAMRRYWEAEIANGRLPTGADLSRAAGVPPTTGLGRRKRREWVTELSREPATSEPANSRTPLNGSGLRDEARALPKVIN